MNIDTQDACAIRGVAELWAMDTMARRAANRMRVPQLAPTVYLPAARVIPTSACTC